jgi:hypothetical protein
VYHFKEGEMEDSAPGDSGTPVMAPSIKKPKYFPLKSITVTPSRGFGYITFDTEFFLLREIRSSVSKTRNRVVKLKNRLGRIKNTLLRKKT